jgi:hypothetical protein
MVELIRQAQAPGWRFRRLQLIRNDGLMARQFGMAFPWRTMIATVPISMRRVEVEHELRALRHRYVQNSRSADQILLPRPGAHRQRFSIALPERKLYFAV